MNHTGYSVVTCSLKVHREKVKAIKTRREDVVRNILSLVKKTISDVLHNKGVERLAPVDGHTHQKRVDSALTIDWALVEVSRTV